VGPKIAQAISYFCFRHFTEPDRKRGWAAYREPLSLGTGESSFFLLEYSVKYLLKYLKQPY